MYRKGMLVLAVALLGVMLVSTVSARSDDSKPAPSFSKLDRNHDGRLTRSEIPHSMHKLRREFRQYDRDGNGWLSKREYQAYARPAVFRKLP